MSKYLHALNLIPELGPKRLERIIDYFPDLKHAWQANYSDLQKAKIEPRIISRILKNRETINPDQEWEKILTSNIGVITIKNKNYPQQLKEIYNPPAILYYQGNIDLLNSISIAVVGSRKISEYGIRASNLIVKQLASAGLTIISGLALGVDTMAHKNANHTIAVLGSGINNHVIFPYENRKLAQNLIENNSLVISEYPPNMKAQRAFFPMRNRIISGLSLGTLVIEARERSGALITAFKALEQNREVFIVPGSIFNKNSDGTHYLLKKGATAITSGQEIIDELHLDLSVKEKPEKLSRNLTLTEEKIINILSDNPLHIDKIIQNTRLNPGIVVSLLTQMELDEIITNLGNNKYIKNV
ncbi:MAG: DNA-processing protein DprA [Patescibacteria group bacterium]